MPRTRKIEAKSLRDLRQASGNGEQGNVTIEAASSTTTDEPEVSYRDLQAQAKERGISARQTREELEAALADQ
jgi:hypothetical protein